MTGRSPEYHCVPLGAPRGAAGGGVILVAVYAALWYRTSVRSRVGILVGRSDADARDGVVQLLQGGASGGAVSPQLQIGQRAAGVVHCGLPGVPARPLPRESAGTGTGSRGGTAERKHGTPPPAAADGRRPAGGSRSAALRRADEQRGEWWCVEGHFAPLAAFAMRRRGASTVRASRDLECERRFWRGRYAADASRWRRGRWYRGARHDNFDVISTPAQAYDLGLLAADGWITGNHTVGLGLQIKDLSLLEEVRDRLAPGRSISQACRVRLAADGTPLTFESARLSFTSRDMVAALARHGVVRRKSAVLSWPRHLADDMLRLVLLGYADGDGCSTRTSRGDAEITILGTRDFLSGAVALIRRCTDVRIGDPHRVHPNGVAGCTACGEGRCWLARIKVTGAQAIRLDHWLHAGHDLGLQRKRFLIDGMELPQRRRSAAQRDADASELRRWCTHGHFVPIDEWPPAGGGHSPGRRTSVCPDHTRSADRARYRARAGECRRRSVVERRADAARGVWWCVAGHFVDLDDVPLVLNRGVHRRPSRCPAHRRDDARDQRQRRKQSVVSADSHPDE